MKTKLIRLGVLAVMLVAGLLVSAPNLQAAPMGTCTSLSSGNWNNTARWSCSAVPTSTDDVTIAAAHTITYDLASSTIQSLTVNGVLNFNAAASDSLTVTGNVVINGTSGVIAAVSATGTRTHTLNVGGNFTNNDTFTAVGGDDIITVVLNGSAAQTIGGSVATTFENLTLSNTSATINATTSFNLNGTFTVNANVVFSPGAAVQLTAGTSNTITGTGTIQVTAVDATNAFAGQYNFDTNTFTGTVDFAAAGNQQIDAITYGTLRTSGSGTKTTAADFTVNTAVVVGAGTTLAFGSATDDVTLGANASLTVNGTLDFASGPQFQSATSGTHVVTMGASGLIRTSDPDGLGPSTTANLTPFETNSSGQWNLTGLGASGTVEYYGAAQTVADMNYNNLTFSGSGTKTLTRTVARTVSGNLTMSGSAALTLAGNFALNVGGNWDDSSSGALTDATTGAVVFNGIVAQTIGGSALSAFNNLTSNNATGVSLTANATVNGVLTLTTDLNTGANTLTLGSAATSTGAGDVIGNVSRTTIANGTTYDFGNGNVELTFTSGTPPTSMVVNLVKGLSPFTGAVSRQYTLTPTGGSGYAATVRLRYLETELGTNVETALNLYRYNSGTSTWDLQAPTSRDSVNNWIEKTGVTTFSPWALGTTSPTAVTLSTFSADGDSNTDALPFLGLGIGAIIALGGAIIARKKFSR